MRRIRHRARGGRGFTLVEIMAVVIILAIIAGVTVPNLGGSIETARLETASARVGELLDYCYNAAVATGRVHAVVFSADGREYRVVAEIPPDPEKPEDDAALLEPVRLPGMIESPLPEGVLMTEIAAFETDLISTEENEARILFFPDGTTEFANITLSDARGDRRVVRLNGLSGTVTIEPPSAEGDEDDEARESEENEE